MDLWSQVRIQAARRGLTMQEYVIEALEEAVARSIDATYPYLTG